MSRILLHFLRVIAGSIRNRSKQNEVAIHDKKSFPNGGVLLDTDAAFREAQSAQQAGRLLEARAGYRRILSQVPRFAPALHFLGVNYGQSGEFLEAEHLIRQSIHIQEIPEYYCNLAWVLEQQGKQDEAAHAYRHAIRLAPANGLAYRALGDRLVVQKKYSEAEQAYREALALDSGDAEIHFKLGVTLGELNRAAEAADAYQRALLLRPTYFDASNNLGAVLADLCRFQEAEDAYRQAISLQPDFASAHFNLGQLLQHVGRNEEAESAYRRALDLHPDNTEAQDGLGSVLMTMHRYPEAESYLLAALALKPDFARACGNLAVTLAAMGRLDKAEVVYLKALTMDPDNPFVLHNLANLYSKTNRETEAELAFRKALNLDPNCAEAYSNLALLLQKRGQQEEAEILLRKAVALDSDSAVIHFNLGQLMYETQRYAEAEALLERALTLCPNLMDAYSIIGNLRKATGRYADAEAAYRQALDLNPKLDWPHYNIGLLSLNQKRFKEGWEGFERRWDIPNFHSARRPFPQEKWGGEASGAGGLLIWQEQGVGDVVLYASVIPELIARGVSLVVECEARLVPLFARSFPQANIVARCDPPHAATTLPRWQSPFGSLCQWLRTCVQDFEGRGPYLTPDPAQLSALRNRYRALGNGRRVGISWRSHNEKYGAKKSMSLLEWAPILALRHVTFVNLQYGDCEADLSQLKREGITVHSDGLVDPLKDLDTFAAQVAAMDLVICVSNTTAHFAGALGVPVWLLLPNGGDALLWYWGSEGETNLWYPSMRIFRQEQAGDWAGVMMRVEAALRKYGRCDGKRFETQ